MITVSRIKDDSGFTVGMTVIMDSHESFRLFAEMVQRATNLWPDASPEIKEFADQITNHKLLQEMGKERGLQDYKSQATDQRKTKE